MRFIFYFLIIGLLLHSCTIRDKQTDNAAVTLNPYDFFYQQIKEGESLLKEGDLVVRNGGELSSQLIRNFNRQDKSYSHSGLVFFEGDQPYVYHIVAGDENPDLMIRKDSLKNYCNPRKNFGFAIYRYDMEAAEIQRLRSQLNRWSVQNVRFDSSFSLTSNDQMYCSEMIKKGLAMATNNRIVISTTKPTPTEAKFASTRLPLTEAYIRKLDLVTIDNLYLNPACRLIRRFDFNPGK